MKKLHLFGSLLIAFLISPSCLDNETYIRSDVWLNITDHYVDDTVSINTPFTVSVYTKTDNSCIGDLRFLGNRLNDSTLQFFARGTYINRGEPCYLLETTEDSTFTLTLTKTGSYFFEFYSIDSLRATVDTLIIVTK